MTRTPPAREGASWSGVRYTVEDGILRLETRGTYSIDRFLACYRKGLGDPAWTSGLVLSDSRESEVIRSPADMRRVAEFVAAQERIRAVAVVVPGDAQFGLTRIAGALASHRGAAIEAFRTVEEARDWLAARDRA